MSDPLDSRASLVGELSAVHEDRPAARRAEVAAMLRLTDGVTVRAGRAAFEADLGSTEAASRLHRAILELHRGSPAVRRAVANGSLLRVPDATDLTRVVGLLDGRGRPVRGLPPPMVAGGAATAAGLWRGALLIRGTLTHPGGRPQLQVACPCPEVALALAGTARRLGVAARARETLTDHRVVVRDPDGIEAVLRAAGACRAGDLVHRQSRRPRTAGPARRPDFDSANAHRAASAAAVAAARAHRALLILDGAAPSHLIDAGRLRAEHARASLDELGRLCEPPISKDAVAGRLRRLLALADARAARAGIPDTHARP